MGKPGEGGTRGGKRSRRRKKIKLRITRKKFHLKATLERLHVRCSDTQEWRERAWNSSFRFLYHLVICLKLSASFGTGSIFFSGVFLLLPRGKRPPFFPPVAAFADLFRGSERRFPDPPLRGIALNVHISSGLCSFVLRKTRKFSQNVNTNFAYREIARRVSQTLCNPVIFMFVIEMWRLGIYAVSLFPSGVVLWIGVKWVSTSIRQ